MKFHSMKTLLYKMSHSFLPCILLTLCIGFCYAWSLFTPHITAAIGCPPAMTQLAFCLNIFFLGMGAAFFGPLAEKNIKLATATSSILLAIGLGLTGLACFVHSLSLLYIGAGVCCGLAEGCGYVAPNKNMLLWFPSSKAKGFLTAFSIFSFGLGSAVCAVIFKNIFPILGIGPTFLALATIYAVPSFIATLLIQKPRYAQVALKANPKSDFSYVKTFHQPFFRTAWIYMFTNITCGLVIIGSCAGILAFLGLSPAVVLTTMVLCGIANGGGRLLFPLLSDWWFSGPSKKRAWIWFIIAALELVASLFCYVVSPQAFPIVAVLINATYGAAFATLPSVLENHYGKSCLSQIHGFCLTSWGMASLAAYAITVCLFAIAIPSLPVLFCVLSLGYALNCIFAAQAIMSNSKKS